MRLIMPFLPSSARRYIWTFITASCLLALLDVAALMLMALSISAMLTGADVNVPVVGVVQEENYVWLLLAVSGLILLKSTLSLWQQWAATRRFAEFELVLGVRLFDAYIGAPWVERLGRTSSQLVRMADVGVSAVISGLVLPLMGIPTLVLSTTLIAATLFFVQPLTAVVTVLYLGLIALLMSWVLTKRAVQAGRVNRDYSYKVASLMTDMVAALKEVTLRDKVDEVAEVVREHRVHAARARANIQFLGGVPKFILDTALIGGFLIVGTLSYLVEGSLAAAISAIALFAVAGLRLVPALTTFQSASNSINANRAQVNAVLRDMRYADRQREHRETLGREPLEDEPKELILRDVSFTYPTGDEPAVSNVSMTIKMGSSIGLVGESGSGKSTLVDILLGLLVPQSGSIHVDQQNLSDVLAAWRSRVGYVPQEVALFDGTVAQNVALAWKGDIDEDKVVDCLKRAQLWDAVQKRPGGIGAKVGERGMGFSGGQRQRLGIARALYTDPYVLILDEATSALDTITEAEVAKAVSALRGNVTVISIAHRLSTVRDADELFFMEDGLILAHGTFDEVVDEVPTFRQQATLAGLISGTEPGPVRID
ncbi:ABC transporter ATP-binding protein [Microbacterium sp. Sa1CUA4]|uniref:ABC transporter ATP-binding protein n=2 Tax=Microbacterium gallinarum TaxID=2762209 RepID=A0ABR8WZ80_9MICO|nr:ABC transporter ATP-binding protein [Microbacterium gallinarum]